MRTEYRFTCALRHGLHARPASMLAEVARRFAAEVKLSKDASDGPPAEPADARSVLSVVGLNIEHGDRCVLKATGADAGAAIAALKEFVETQLAEGDELPAPSPGETAAAVGGKLPVGLRRAGVAHVSGRAVCAGIAMGEAVTIGGMTLPESARTARAVSVEAELEAAHRAVASVRHDLRRRAAQTGARLESDLLRAHGEIADDPALWAQIERHVRSGATAAQAVAAAAERFSEQLSSAGSAYIRDRVVDVQDVCMQLLDRLTGGGITAMHVKLARESIVFAETLTANQLLHLDRELLKGLVLGRIGATAHTVILARSLRIPTLIEVPEAARLTKGGGGGQAVVDGDGGFVITSVTPAVQRYYQREQRTRQKWLDKMAPLARRPAVTRDGARLEVGANASSAAEIAAAVAQGADGVGLFRTEVLFLERTAPPGEDEQLEIYAAAIDAAEGRPVIIRTFDIGGDKPAPYLHMAREENPFLGIRGLRLYERHPALLRTQLRAIVRASARGGGGGGGVKVMAPMVATPAEAAWFRGQVRQVQDELRGEGGAFDEAMPIGIMIEIPAAALVMDQLCDHADFFSLGTNDLCQYWMAVDRGNTGVAGLYNPRQPSFLRLLRTIVQGAKARGKWVGVCGEMAGERRNLALMLGLGVDEISVAPGDVLGLKTAVQAAEASRCRALVEAAAACRTTHEVEDLLANTPLRPAEGVGGGGRGGGIIDAEAIQVGCDALTKEEAIKDAVDLLFLVGRTERPREVEEAVWAREETYSTGLGFGFAVPHCKTDAVATPTLAVLKLHSPVEWGSMDGQPVQVVLLLAVPAAGGGAGGGGGGGAHMKVFAKLARRLMHEEFRERMMAASDAPAIEACLRQELELG